MVLRLWILLKFRHSCQVVGSRNPHNTVKAVFKALNEVSGPVFQINMNAVNSEICILTSSVCFQIETPKDVQEKFGRTVVQKYLL